MRLPLAVSALAFVAAPVALAAPLVVPVTIDPTTVQRRSTSFGSIFMVSEVYACQFASFDFDPAANPEGIRFAVSFGAGGIADVRAGASLYISLSSAVSGTCGGGTAFDQFNQRGFPSAASDDAIDGDGAPTIGGAADSVTTSPYGYDGVLSLDPAVSSWRFRSASIGIPAYGQPANRHGFCSCSISAGGTFSSDPLRIMTIYKFESLFDVTNAPVATCPEGGILVHRGLDDGRPGGIPNDGVLQPEEREQTFNVCNGADGSNGVDGAPGANGRDGTDGAPGTPGAPGSTGAAGTPGTPGADGQDGKDAAPGAPGAAGAPGANGHGALVDVEDVPAGDLCAAGGVRVLTGIDDGAEGGTADDGVLQAGEKRREKVVCGGVAGRDGANGKDGSGCASVPGVTWFSALAAGLVQRRRRTRA